jgi:lysophospholipase L1-like esterase
MIFTAFFEIGCTHDNELAQMNMTEKKNSAPVIYVALGDSTGVGVGAQNGGYVAHLFARIKRENASARLDNLCMSGATSDDVLRDQVRQAISAQPTLITLCIGINDVGRNVDVERFTRNCDEIVARLRSETHAAIVLSNIPDVSFAPAIPTQLREPLRARVSLFNERITGIAARENLQIVDAYGVTHELLPTHPEFFSADGFHPSDVGYEFWAKTMWPAVKKAIEAR